MQGCNDRYNCKPVSSEEKIHTKPFLSAGQGHCCWKGLPGATRIEGARQESEHEGEHSAQFTTLQRHLLVWLRRQVLIGPDRESGEV